MGQSCLQMLTPIQSSIYAVPCQSPTERRSRAEPTDACEGSGPVPTVPLNYDFIRCIISLDERLLGRDDGVHAVSQKEGSLCDWNR